MVIFHMFDLLSPCEPKSHIIINGIQIYDIKYLARDNIGSPFNMFNYVLS